MTRLLTKDEDEILREGKTISSFLPIVIGKRGFTLSEYRVSCSQCEHIIPDEHVFGSVRELTQHATVIYTVALCEECCLITCGSRRIKSDDHGERIEWQLANGEWVAQLFETSLWSRVKRWIMSWMK